MRYISGVTICVLIFELIFLTSASPFLYNAGPLFLQSIFRSSSGTPDNGTNVEDLRNNDEPGKLENLQAERKHFARQQEGENTNDATPQFIQKKIDKILYKLRLFSQLSGPFNFGGTTTDNKEPDDFDFDADSDEKNDTLATPVSVSDNDKPPVITSTAEESAKNRSQRFSLSLPSLKQESIEEDVNNSLENSDGNSNKVSPSTIGVYLMEMFGTVLTLIYGAAVQFQEANTVPTQI